MTDEQPAIDRNVMRRGWPYVTFFLLTVCVFVGYIFSYAVCLRVVKTQIAVYKPAEWLLLCTPLQKPLLLCGTLCGTEQEMSIMIEKEILKTRIQRNLEYIQKLQEESSIVICDVPTISIKQNFDDE